MSGGEEALYELLVARVHSLLQRATPEVDIRLLLLYVASRSLQRVSIAKPFPPKSVLLNTADTDDGDDLWFKGGRTTMVIGANKNRHNSELHVS